MVYFMDTSFNIQDLLNFIFFLNLYELLFLCKFKILKDFIDISSDENKQQDKL